LGTHKLRKKIYYFIINRINPSLILDVHWLSEPSKIHWLWDKMKGNKSKFIVIQHGVYTGGKISQSFDETNPRTFNFWVWSDYYKIQFEKIFKQKGKLVNIRNFGNSVYNHFDRTKFNYSLHSEVKSILISPTKLNDYQSRYYKELIRYFQIHQIDVKLKFHNYQELSFFSDYENLIATDSIYDLLKNQSVDLVISDVSSVLLDAIFFKKAVLYFQPFQNENEFIITNIYNEYLSNYFIQFKDGCFDLNDIGKYIDIDAQELLLSRLISLGSNSIT
jgi:hypothetical protein